MKTEDEVEAWYEEQKRKALDTLNAELERKVNIDEAEERYTKDLKKIFEQYKKDVLKIAENQPKQKRSFNTLSGVLSGLLSVIRIGRR